MGEIQFAHAVFKRLLRVFLAEKRWTVEVFANELGVTRQTVYNWINGDKKPPLKRIAKIAKVLKCEPASLLKGIK